jgi:hypothetical protein
VFRSDLMLSMSMQKKNYRQQPLNFMTFYYTDDLPVHQLLLNIATNNCTDDN